MSRRFIASRRGGARGAGGRAPTPGVLSTYGLEGWSASSGLGTATPGGIAGSAVAGLSVVALVYLKALPSGNQNIASRRLSANTGWHMRSSGTSMLFTTGNGTALAASPARTWVAGDVGKFHVIGGSHNLSAVFQYFDAAQVGASTAQAGYTPESTYTCIGTGTIQATNPSTNYAIVSVAGRDSHLTLADFQIICAATKAAGVLSLGGIPMDHQWDAPQNATVPSTVNDVIGTDHLSFLSGSAANLSSVAYPRVWGF
jgi:hypothetical protein